MCAIRYLFIFCKFLHRSLDLSENKISNFAEIVKLGKIETLKCLNVAGNGIKCVELPDCRPDEQLNIFVNLVELVLRDNPIEDKVRRRLFFANLNKLKCPLIPKSESHLEPFVMRVLVLCKMSTTRQQHESFGLCTKCKALNSEQ